MLSNNFEENHVLLLLKCDEFMDVNLALDGVWRKGGHEHRARSHNYLQIKKEALALFSSGSEKYHYIIYIHLLYG